MRVLLHAKSVVVADLPGFEREHAAPGLINPFYADADLTAEQAGRLCYLSGHRPNPKTAANGAYLLNICAQKHYSVLGHAAASFYIETSRNCTHEIIRHRWFTFSEVSQRFVDADILPFEMHPGMPRDAELFRAIDDRTDDARALYGKIVTDLTEAEYTRKQARQAARSVLPSAMQTRILMSGNIRAWRDFLAQRLSPHADAEIQAVAFEIFKIMKDEFPNSFQDFDSRGMITTERLVKRALARLDAARDKDPQWGSGARKDFEDEVRNIMEQGLWVLRDDPWLWEEIERLGV